MGGGRTVFLLLFSLQLSSSFLFSAGSLYNSTDELVILDHNNFHSTILGTENAWVVEFYNSWCGHCINFAPTWKLFAKDVWDWQHTIKVGVIDCSVDDAIPICREYEIMSYPSIQLFAARTSKGDIGKAVNSRTVEEMGKSLVDFLVEKQRAKNGSESWVNLQPYQGSLSDIWKGVSSSVEHLVVIVDHAGSYTGKLVTLDLGGYSKIAVRVMEGGGGEVKELRSASNPTVIFMDRNGQKEVVDNAAATRKDLTKLIMKKYNLFRSMLPFNKAGRDEGSKKNEVEGAGDGRPEEIHSDKLNYEDDLPDTAYTGSERRDQVYMVDIENAVSYALHHEVVQHKIISGEALKALQDFLDVLVLYLPARPAVHEFLSRLHKYTTTQGDRIHGEKLAENIKSLQDQESVLPDQQQWIGCKGSEPKFRGYPCGLWTTFHTITVNAVLQEGNSVNFSPKKTLQAIHGYVKHFFSCSYCSKHFQEMYALDAESSVNVADDGIIWLWRGHNKVNKRLRGDASEDPHHIKEPFPTRLACPACWDSKQLKEKDVLAYLKGIYSKRALSFKGTQTIVAPVMNRQAKIKKVLDSHRAEKERKEGQTVNKKHYNIEEEQPLRPLHTWGFNSTDVSLCVFLYGISTIIIMSVYCMVVIRRKLRRRKFFETYKQPSEGLKKYLIGAHEDIIARVHCHLKQKEAAS
ncbi:sulfhydryl oxidase 2-like isoform X1 [Penaeus monodon]|uniref:sulfhydryl oxidase 2-like isoform X1 n=2 Tax=Penaeus monodon TaxID=6687 RepID=UPI0018A7B8DA|nr:sulfhydryl oxidase 2-like isoform X1 [Penaeus monodon]